jgi:hypothetical protein
MTLIYTGFFFPKNYEGPVCFFLVDVKDFYGLSMYLRMYVYAGSMPLTSLELTTTPWLALTLSRVSLMSAGSMPLLQSSRKMVLNPNSCAWFAVEPGARFYNMSSPSGAKCDPRDKIDLPG